MGSPPPLFPPSTPAGGMEVVEQDRGASGHGGKVVGWQGMAWRGRGRVRPEVACTNSRAGEFELAAGAQIGGALSRRSRRRQSESPLSKATGLVTAGTGDEHFGPTTVKFRPVSLEFGPLIGLGL